VCSKNISHCKYCSHNIKGSFKGAEAMGNGREKLDFMFCNPSYAKKAPIKDTFVAF
jgi:hypothetical protein